MAIVLKITIRSSSFDAPADLLVVRWGGDFRAEALTTQLIVFAWKIIIFPAKIRFSGKESRFTKLYPVQFPPHQPNEILDPPIIRWRKEYAFCACLLYYEVWCNTLDITNYSKSVFKAHKSVLQTIWWCR